MRRYDNLDHRPRKTGATTAARPPSPTEEPRRIDRTGEWISTGSTDLTHTVTGLTNGRTYVLEVRAVNSVGPSPASSATDATPMAEEVVLEFAHFGNGYSGDDVLITSDLVLVNVGEDEIRPVIYFFDRAGELLEAETVVDVGIVLEVEADGGLMPRLAVAPLGELTISTHGRGEVVTGSVRVVSDGPLGGVVRFDIPGIGVAGVGASEPTRDALFPARRQAGGIRTAAAVHNLGMEAVDVQCRLMKDGVMLEEKEIPLSANGQEAKFIDELFTQTDTTDFVGSVRCTAPANELFTGVAVELDSNNGIFTTLPVVPVDPEITEDQETTLTFAHFANGTSDDGILDHVGSGAGERGRVDGPSRHLLLRSAAVELLEPESMVDVEDDLLVREDGGLTVRTAVARLGELTISTHGRGEVVAGSVRVVSNGPMGGVLRFDIPGVGVAGVGASQPTADALFPARRQAGKDPDSGGDPEPGSGAGNGSLLVDERGRSTGGGGHPSQRPRTTCPLHRRGVHEDGYDGLRGIGQVHGSWGGEVHRSGGGIGHRRPDLHHPAGGSDSTMIPVGATFQSPLLPFAQSSILRAAHSLMPHGEFGSWKTALPAFFLSHRRFGERMVHSYSANLAPAQPMAAPPNTNRISPSTPHQITIVMGRAITPE